MVIGVTIPNILYERYRSIPEEIIMAGLKAIKSDEKQLVVMKLVA